jgi:hypothetical protein
MDQRYRHPGRWRSGAARGVLGMMVCQVPQSTCRHLLMNIYRMWKIAEVGEECGTMRNEWRPDTSELLRSFYTADRGVP